MNWMRNRTKGTKGVEKTNKTMNEWLPIVEMISLGPVLDLYNVL